MTKIAELLDDIRTQDLVLPEFQREYVWTRDQAKQLIVSLVKGYPVGGLLIWKTDKPPELKNIAKLPDKMGTVQVPWAALRANIIEQRGRIDVKADDFEGRTAQHPLYRMVYILAKAHDAVDWFNGVPLGNDCASAPGRARLIAGPVMNQCAPCFSTKITPTRFI